MTSRCTGLCCLLLLAGIQSGAVARGETNHPPAPDFHLTDMGGKPLSLSGYRGKVVLLNFWATWCGPCRIETPGLVELERRYGRQGLAVIGISLDEQVQQVQEFSNQYKLNYSVAQGNEQVAQAYGGIFSLPVTFLIGRDGRIYAKHLGATDRSVFEAEVRQLLPGSPKTEFTGFQPRDGKGAEEIEPVEVEEIWSEVPGVNLARLTDSQKQAYKKRIEMLNCPCGCQLTVMNCRRDDHQCGFSLRIARQQLVSFGHSHP